MKITFINLFQINFFEIRFGHFFIYKLRMSIEQYF